MYPEDFDGQIAKIMMVFQVKKRKISEENEEFKDYY